MADILIRGFEMPKDRSLWLLIRPDGIAFKTRDNDKFGLSKEGTAIFLPEEYGRLIDADAVIEAYTPDSYDLNKMHMTRESFDKLPTVAAIKKAIRNAPTIVPAKGGGENG